MTVRPAAVQPGPLAKSTGGSARPDAGPAATRRQPTPRVARRIRRESSPASSLVVGSASGRPDGSLPSGCRLLGLPQPRLPLGPPMAPRTDTTAASIGTHRARLGRCTLGRDGAAPPSEHGEIAVDHHTEPFELGGQT